MGFEQAIGGMERWMWWKSWKETCTNGMHGDGLLGSLLARPLPAGLLIWASFDLAKLLPWLGLRLGFNHEILMQKNSQNGFPCNCVVVSWNIYFLAQMIGRSLLAHIQLFYALFFYAICIYQVFAISSSESLQYIVPLDLVISLFHVYYKLTDHVLI
jgi:hypothetical protein